MISNADFAAIAELDLEPIKVKLMHEESGEGWSLDMANSVETDYRRFLYLMKMYPNEEMAPLMDVDIFWHYHILDTMKYAADCDKVFGYFVHHFPYLGLRGEDDEQAHHAAGARMQQVYEATFGEAYVREREPSCSTAKANDAVAFSIHPPAAKVAFSIHPPAVKSAFSIHPPAVKTAFSIHPPAVKTAFSIQPPAAKTAFSIQPPAAKTAFSIHPPANKYSERPRLAA